MVRVAFVSARLDFNDGVASHIELLSSELRRQGVEVAMITGLTTGHALAPARHANMRQLMSPWHELGEAQLRFSVATVWRLAGLLRRGGFDLVHVHGLGLLPAVRAALAGTGIPVAATYHPSAHGNTASDFKLGFTIKQRAAYRVFLEMFGPDRLVALSRDTDKLFVEQCGFARGRVARIIAGIDDDHFRPPCPAERAAVRQRLGLPPGALVCVLPGRLNLNKGHDVAVAATDRLRTSRPDRDVRFLFPGGGAQEAEIRALVAESRAPDRFTMPGFVPEMRDMYWAADIVVLPSRNEGFALVVAEAMACGCAAIRTPSGGCTDQVIENHTGFVVWFNDPETLADRIGRFTDPDRLARMREAALALARQRFSRRRMGDEMMRLYRQLAPRATLAPSFRDAGRPRQA